MMRIIVRYPTPAIQGSKKVTDVMVMHYLTLTPPINA